MRPLDQCSGPWRGRWFQPDPAGLGPAQTGLERVTLRFEGGKMDGRGEDADGAFVFRGRYNGARVRFRKAYLRPAWHVAASLTYEGAWDGAFIGGVWSDDAERANRGPFELWPLTGEGEELSLAGLNEAADDAPAGLDAPARERAPAAA